MLAESAQEASRSFAAYSWVRHEAKAPCPRALGWKDCRTEFESGGIGLVRFTYSPRAQVSSMHTSCPWKSREASR